MYVWTCYVSVKFAFGNSSAADSEWTSSVVAVSSCREFCQFRCDDRTPFDVAFSNQ